MLLGGGALTVYALTRRRPGIALAAAGGLLAYRGATLGTTKFRARASFAINCEPETAFRMWRGLENLPIFMRHLESVRERGNGRSEWTAIGPMGKRLRWNAEITEDRENEFLAWRSTQDSDFQNWGSVEFRRAPGNRGTIVTAEMEYAPPGGALGKVAAAIFGKDPSSRCGKICGGSRRCWRCARFRLQRTAAWPRSAVISAVHTVYPERRKPTEYSAGERVAAQRRAS